MLLAALGFLLIGLGLAALLVRPPDQPCRTLSRAASRNASAPGLSRTV